MTQSPDSASEQPQKRTMRRWSDEEKQNLIQAVQRHTKNERVNWNAVKTEMPGRTANQCKTQYLIVLQKRETKVNRPWSALENNTLVFLVSYYGKHWAQIQQSYFPERTPDQLRVKYTSGASKRHDFKDLAQKLLQGEQIGEKSKLKQLQDYIKQIKAQTERLERSREDMENGLKVIPSMDLVIVKMLDQYVNTDTVGMNLRELEQLLERLIRD